VHKYTKYGQCLPEFCAQIHKIYKLFTIVKITMVKKFLHPQEIETYYVIPTIRKYMALSMKERGMKQMHIAKILAIKDAAVSQYISEKRGNQLQFDKKIIDEIKKATEHMQDEKEMVKETQRILSLIRENATLCAIHKKYCIVPKECNPKEMNCIAYERF
jgi:uncharacterized protein